MVKNHISIPGIVFDPCVGLGTTAKACKKIKALCFGNELNEKRAEKTMLVMKEYDRC
jgi:DNA modification methylase